MITTTYVAKDMLNIQIAASEFKSAENLAITIDNEITNLLYKPGSARVIKTSFSSTAPGYTRTGETMNVTIGDLEPYIIDVNILSIEGRQIITGAPEYDLRGDSSLIVFNYNGSIGRVRVSKPRNMQVSLDYERVLCTFTGMINLFDGSELVPHNTIELTAVILDFGEFDVEDGSTIIIQNEVTSPDVNTLTGNFELRVESQEGVESIFLTDLDGNPDFDTQVTFYSVYIRVSVLGGG